MIRWSTVGKLAVLVAVIGGAVGAGILYADGDLPVDEDTPENDTPGGPVVAGGEPTPTATPTPKQSIDDPSDYSFDREALENRIQNEINDYRKGQGMDDLRWEPLLKDPARRHAQAMATDQVVSVEAGGATASERVSDALTCGPGVTLARVDAASGGTPSAVVTEWGENERTRETLLDNIDDRMAVGAAQGADGRVYIVAVLC